MVASNAGRRFRSLFAFLPPLIFSCAGAMAADTEFSESPYGIGQETCGVYLSDIARDPEIQHLYDAWLSGYIAVISPQIPGDIRVVRETGIGGASAWVKTYCLRRASDSYLTAAVRLIEASASGRLGAAPAQSPIRVADRPSTP
jgi:hypothetical protein